MTIDQAVTMIAGLIASGKILYDWHREARSDDPPLSAECRKMKDGRTLLTLRAIRLPTEDYFVHRIRARGFSFVTTAGPKSELTPDRLVQSQTAPPISPSGRTLPFEFWELPVDQICAVPRMATIQVSISRTAGRSRERWKTITVKTNE